MKTGDVVNLKSGGPNMVIERVSRVAVCSYIDDSGNSNTIMFDSKCLNVIRENKDKIGFNKVKG